MRFRRRFGIADKDQRAAWSPRNSRRVIGPDDFDAVEQAWHSVESDGDILVGLHMRTIHEAHKHVAHAGFNLDRESS